MKLSEGLIQHEKTVVIILLVNNYNSHIMKP